jgi:hypothetical protein
MAKRGTRSQVSRDVRPSEKAEFHQIKGAGKKKVKRRFFGISPTDEVVITREVGTMLDKNLQRQG